MDEGVDQRRPIILVMESDPLLRWSLTTYLRRFFTVFAIAEPGELPGTVHADLVDAIVASDNADALRRGVHKLNSNVVTIQMVASATDPVASESILSIEKPFELSALADLLWEAMGAASDTPNGVKTG